MRNKKRRRLAQESEENTQEAPLAPIAQEEELPEPEEITEEAPERKSFFSKD